MNDRSYRSCCRQHLLMLTAHQTKLLIFSFFLSLSLSLSVWYGSSFTPLIFVWLKGKKKRNIMISIGRRRHSLFIQKNLCLFQCFSSYIYNLFFSYLLIYYSWLHSLKMLIFLWIFTCIIATSISSTSISMSV